MNLDFLKRISIKMKLNLVAGMVASFLLLIGLVAFVFISKVGGFYESSRKVGGFHEEFLQMRKHEKDFLMKVAEQEDFFETGESPYLNEWKASWTKVSTYYQSLSEDPTIERFGMRSNLDSIWAQGQQYSALFNQLVGEIKKKGDPRTGVVGGSLTAGREVFESFDKYADQAVLVDLSARIQLAQQAYRIRGNPDNMSALLKAIEETNSLLKAYRPDDSLSGGGFIMAPADVMLAINSLEKYKLQIQKLFEADQLIGFGFEDGLKGEVLRLSKETESDLAFLRVTLESLNDSKAASNFIWLAVVILFIALLQVFVIFRISRGIINPLNHFKEHILELGKGELPAPTERDVQDEIGLMSLAINNLTDNLRNTKQFVTEIGKGNLQSEVNVFNNRGELGEALVQMRSEMLNIAQQRELQQAEDNKRNWATQGLAKFSDILRESSDDIAELSYKVLKELVNYLGANQGVIFIVNDADPQDLHLELTAAYAYERRKFLEKRLDFGEGIAGTVALEKHMAYMEELPEGHFEISTGLGFSEPKSLLIVPLQTNDELFGVVEVASFKTLEPYQRDFALKIAESVAATIASVKISIKTARLLEESRVQAEELASKEEEMRQNMEELQATQEEAARKEALATGFVNSVNSTLLRADMRPDGMILESNFLLSNHLGFHHKELDGRSIFELVQTNEQEDFREQWSELASSEQSFEAELRWRTKSGAEKWLWCAFSMLHDAIYETQKVMMMALDIHHHKQTTLAYETERKAADESLALLRAKLDGSLAQANPIARKLLSLEEPFPSLLELVHPEEKQNFELSWLQAATGKAFTTTSRLLTAKGDRWLELRCIPRKDSAKAEVAEVVITAKDITALKIAEKELIAKSEMLSAQSDKLGVANRKLEVLQGNLREKDEALQSLKAQLAEKEQTIKDLKGK